MTAAYETGTGPICILPEENNPRAVQLEAALTELLRLYDWRFELAAEEKVLKIMLSSGEWLQRTKTLKNNLRLYGEQKKAAWEVARKLLHG